MQTQIGTILNKTQTHKLQILTCPTHERFESLFAHIDADFHAIKTPNTKDWNSNYASQPQNYYVWDRMPHHITFDLVLSQNKFGQFQFLAPLAHRMNLPLISIEHTTVMPWWSQKMKENLSMMSGSLNVFICEHQRTAWNVRGESVVIGHCVDSNMFKDRGYNREGLLTVANDFINRDSVLNYRQFQQLSAGIPTTIVGDTPGLSKPQYINEIVHTYSRAAIYLNTAHLSPMPTSLLEAMSSECACVSVNACGIPEYIIHGVNGFLYNNEKEGKEYTNLLLNDKNLRDQLGRAARETILNKCNVNNCVKSYQRVFSGVIQ